VQPTELRELHPVCHDTGGHQQPLYSFLCMMAADPCLSHCEPSLRPGLIGKMLDLKRGGNNRYQKTAAYGHFGRSDPDFTWEQVVPLS
jgi:hypothetical protein